MIRRALSWLPLGAVALALAVSAVVCLPLLLVGAGWDLVCGRSPMGRRAIVGPISMRFVREPDVATEFAALADAHPDLAGYGRQLDDLYLIPRSEEY